MNEPRRLREESTSSFERAILDAGVSYRSSADAKLRTLAALGIAGSAVASASAASYVASVLGKLSWGKLVVGISALGVVGALPVAYWMTRGNPEPLEPPVVAALAKPSLPPTKPLHLAAPPPKAPLEAAAARGAGEEREAAAAMAPSRSTRLESKSALPSAVLTAELGALDAARSALAKGDARRALVLLDSYAKNYPRGRLMLEAEVLRIDALARSGETQAAKQRAATFLRRHPNSVLSARVRTYLDG